jgi:Ca-activated chloride channel family protein
MAALVAGFSPFLREERNVREGNERIASGDPAGALPHYEAAEREAGPRAEIDFDRGVARYRGGRADEARDEWRRALERGAGPLASRASQNLGNALAALGDREGAKNAFVEALRQDPRNEDARFNLEVLLRKEEEERRKGGQQQQDREQQGQQQRQQQPQQRQQQQHADQKPEQAQEQEREQREARQQQQQQAPGAEEDRDEARERREGTSKEAERMTQEEAERLLDAFRSRERPMPLAGKERRSSWRHRAGKDW